MALARSKKTTRTTAGTVGGSGSRAERGRAASRGGDAATAAPHFDIQPGGGRLGELLVDQKVIRRSQLVETLLSQSGSGKKLGTLLLDRGVVDERTLINVLADQLQIDLVDFRSAKPDADALELIPEPIARSLNAIPLRRNGEKVDIVVGDPSSELRAELEKTAKLSVHMLLAPPSDINRVINTSYKVLSEVGRHVEEFTAADAPKAKKAAAASSERALTDEAAPVVQIANKLITQGLRDRASDIHIEPQDDIVRVRYRIDGALHDGLELPGAMGPALASRIKIMAGMNIVERRRPQDGQIATRIDGRDLDIRVSTLSTIWGEKCVLRLLDKSRPLYKLGDLGMPADTHAEFSKIIRSPFGMVICAGPTGSGKTTTLYASLSEINQTDLNIMTIEDPVEYVFPSINQIQTNEASGMSFAGGLKSILRQDPDVILVGEIRDVETARIATQSALTGHFVMSSLHATDSVAALHRFLDMGIESFLIASSVVAVVGQRLVRRICSSCKVPYKPTAEELSFYQESGGRAKTKFFHGTGCNFCADTGYQDRVGVYELLKVTPEIKRLVVGWATQEELRRMATSQGTRTLREEAVALVQQDITTISEVIRSIYAA